MVYLWWVAPGLPGFPYMVAKRSSIFLSPFILIFFQLFPYPASVACSILVIKHFFYVLSSGLCHIVGHEWRLIRAPLILVKPFFFFRLETSRIPFRSPFLSHISKPKKRLPLIYFRNTLLRLHTLSPEVLFRSSIY